MDPRYPRERNVDRRRLLAAAAPAAAALLAACSDSAPAPRRPGRRRRGRPRALVYRGPAVCPGCAESAAALLRGAPRPCAVTYCGPRERVPLSADSLADAEVYVQAGGPDDVDGAWTEVRGSARAVREWVRAGGRYLGFCMGGYLAGSDPGFGLLPGDTDAYTTTPGASVRTSRDTVIAVRWRGRERHMYFQDGPYFDLRKGADATVLATYGNGTVAALVAPFGEGRVGVSGPHPEADRSWYDEAGLSNPDGVRLDLGHDLVEVTTAASGRR
ncbi:BPL-N domain-containing protein [Streptomyces ovatisporus]|uniref:BPL-N domain-containing protein n=1 Tax=Streptomyces ovatisporus TaxID=1128682 RepID=A0ABV9A8G2_9ACTN